MLFRRCRCKFSHTGKFLTEERVRIRQAFAIRFLRIGRESHQRAINEVNDAGLFRSWRFVGRDDSGRHRFHFRSFRQCKEFKFRGGGRGSRSVRVRCSGNHCRPIRGKPSGGKPGGAAREKHSAIKGSCGRTIVIRHAENCMRGFAWGQPQNPKEAKWPFEWFFRRICRHAARSVRFLGNNPHLPRRRACSAAWRLLREQSAPEANGCSTR